MKIVGSLEEVIDVHHNHVDRLKEKRKNIIV